MITSGFVERAVLMCDRTAVLEPDSAEDLCDIMRLEIPARRELLNETIQCIVSYLDETKFNMWFMRLAIEEALINAMEHGNKFDHSKTIYLEVELRNKSCRITVRDQGKGFDCNMVHDPLSEERFDKQRGRGIFLMRKIMDEVIYSRNGREVSLIKNL